MTKRLKKSLPLVVQCPCCDFFTFRDFSSGEVCPVCFWQNDGLDIDAYQSPSLEQLFAQSYANDNKTLDEARSNFENIGACGPEWLKKVCSKNERANFKHEPRRGNVELMRIAAALIGTLESSDIPVFREDTEWPDTEFDDWFVVRSEAPEGGVVYGFPGSGCRRRALKFWSASPSKASAKLQQRVLLAANQSGYSTVIQSSHQASGGWIGTYYRIETPESMKNRYHLHYGNTPFNFNYIEMVRCDVCSVCQS